MKKNSKKPVLSVLREMSVGEMRDFPLARMSYVRSVCASFGLEWGKTFRTALNRPAKKIEVTREK